MSRLSGFEIFLIFAVGVVAAAIVIAVLKSRGFYTVVDERGEMSQRVEDARKKMEDDAS